jgi:hypothetical protein
MADQEADVPRRGAWSTEETLAFDLAFSLPRTRVRGIRRAFTEDEREMIAKGMVEHLKLCGWRFELPPPRTGHGGGRGGSLARVRVAVKRSGLKC